MNLSIFTRINLVNSVNIFESIEIQIYKYLDIRRNKLVSKQL